MVAKFGRDYFKGRRVPAFASQTSKEQVDGGIGVGRTIRRRNTATEVRRGDSGVGHQREAVRNRQGSTTVLIDFSRWTTGAYRRDSNVSQRTGLRRQPKNVVSWNGTKVGRKELPVSTEVTDRRKKEERGRIEEKRPGIL